MPHFLDEVSAGFKSARDSLNGLSNAFGMWTEGMLSDEGLVEAQKKFSDASTGLLRCLNGTHSGRPKGVRVSGKKVKQLRKQRGWTQQALATAVWKILDSPSEGISALRTIQRMEAGERTSMELVKTVAKVFGAPVTAIVSHRVGLASRDLA
jgi:DNA-binding XRE family transcriptional regulator